MNLLEIRNVVKQYSGHLALAGVSLDVPENTIYGLLGPNGAGKTTLIRIINCITAPDSGEVFLNGKKLTSEDVQHIGYLPEERGLYKKMKVGEQSLYLAQLKGMSKQDALKALKYWFEKFEIQSGWNKKDEELSKGMAQKVQFVTTILHQPKLLIFDEPFSGFDPVNTDLLKREIINLKDNGATIIFSTHNMASVEELCDNISLIDKSKIVLQGNVNEIRSINATGTYRVNSKSLINADDNIELLLQKEVYNGFESIVRTKQKGSNNVLISSLLTQSEINSFEEILPTMNDIFIETVTTKSVNHE
ncbi:MAG: ABC transporter ATP-binding protein [Bacteroidales bacterium 36-12]|nr:MAG: ABC transporter ATP-binding protein [Bacteroidales bacterium 36-12]